MPDTADISTTPNVILDVSRDHGFATITLNRPDRLNSLSNELLQSLADTLDVVAADDSIRAVILTGAGQAFCSGADTDEMVGGSGDGPHKPGPGGAERIQACSQGDSGHLPDGKTCNSGDQRVGRWRRVRPCLCVRHASRFRIGTLHGRVHSCRALPRLRRNVALPSNIRHRQGGRTDVYG
ncbi:MAG TPA: enoyl-CoA hydratase/isomerase family protein [Dehalococcoidia bacterium]|nr:enoyl-CoA hydratase/isomerase family protein [Dehalococcoidia bacterium]